MTTSSVIAALNSASDCASNCDCCDKLQQQINSLSAKIAAIKPVDENALKSSIKSSLEPGIATAIAGGVAVAADKLKPQIDNGLAIAKQALAKAFQVETTANNAQTQALKATTDAMKASRDAVEADGKARRAGSTASSAEDIAKEARNGAGTAQNTANHAFDEARQASNEAFTADRKAANALDIGRKASLESDLAKSIANQADLKAGNAVNRSTEAISEATSAGTKAAQAANDALEANNAVGGLRGVVDGLKGRIGALGDAVAKVEGIASEALVKAANAVGISTEALNGIGRLAGKIAEIFNILGTLAALIEQLTTLNTLGGRIDAVEAGLNALGNDVSGILGRLLGLQNRISRNEASIGEVRAIAIDAKGIGEAARQRASEAYIFAGKVEGEAKQAQLTADGAVRNAAIANDNATTAYKKATEAQGIGEQAKNIAGDALSKAGIALTTALTAISLYQGLKALRGLQGIPGIPGAKGDKGDKGDIGVQGFQGIQGIQGNPGKDGKNGINGIGLAGKNGRNGIDVNPADLASLKALIVQQHAQTRTTVNAYSGGLVNGVKVFFTTQLAAITTLITTIATNSYVEKAMQLLTLAATLHNAAMLSNNLAQTLGTVINQCVGFILPKGINGQPINITDVIGHTIEDIVKNAIGTENYTTITTDWAKANRIYQAGANVFNQIGNAVGLVTSGLEVIGGNIGKIGNALKISGVVLQNVYGFMNPQPNMKGKFFEFLNNASTELNTIQMMVAIPIGLAAAGQAVNESVNAFSKTLDQTDPVDQYGNPLHNPDGSIKRYQPGATVPDPVKTILAQEQAKADSTNIIQATIDDIFNGND